MSRAKLYHEAHEAYLTGKPIMSDREFDKLEYELFSNTSAPIGIPGKAELPLKMWSMLKDPKNKLLTSTKCIAQFKIDGIALLLHYKNGVLWRAYTRGDGVHGQDITFHLYPQTEDIPLTIPDITRDIFVIGEAYITKSSAEALDYKNARNGIAGILNQLQHTRGNPHIKFFAFDIVYKDEENAFPTEGHKLKALKDNEFPIVKTFATFEQAYTEASEQRDSLLYLIDGIVIKVLSTKAQQVLGFTERAPRYFSAFKLAADSDFAELIKIEWNVGRTGMVTPLAHFTPVEIGGSTIRKASLHSYSMVKNTKISIGDKLQIIKAGDIIPQIDHIVERSGNESALITQCPSCKSSLQIRGEHAFCIQPGCYDKNIDRLNFACKSLGIKGIGPAKAKEIYLQYKDPTLIGPMIYVVENFTIPKDIPMWKAILAFNTEGLGISGAKKAAKAGKTLLDHMSSTEIAGELLELLSI